MAVGSNAWKGLHIDAAAEVLGSLRVCDVFSRCSQAWARYDKVSFRDLCIRLGVSRRCYEEVFEPMILTGLFAPGDQVCCLLEAPSAAGCGVVCGAVVWSAVQRCALRCSGVLCGAAVCSAVRWCALRRSGVLCGAAVCSAVRRCALRCGGVLCGAALCSAVQRCALQ